MYYHPLFFCIHIYKNIYVDIYIYIQGVVLQIAFSYRGSGGFGRGLDTLHAIPKELTDEIMAVCAA